jgi:hypothetical protein
MNVQPRESESRHLEEDSKSSTVIPGEPENLEEMIECPSTPASVGQVPTGVYI